MATRSPARKKAKIVEEEDEGFRFTRGSRRAKGQQKSSASKSTKKRRRSSFVRGRKERKSLVLPVAEKAPGDELYKNIPDELPQEARLHKLFDGCLQLAIDKLDSDGGISVPDIPDFQVEAKEVFDTLRSIISDSNIIDEAFQIPKQEIRLVQNPKNIEIEESDKAIQDIVEKLRSEVTKWEKLLSSHQEEEKLAEKESQEVNNNVPEECPDFLTPEQHELLSGKTSFKGLFEKQQQLLQQVALQIHQVCKVTNKLRQYNNSSQAFIEKQLSSFSSKTLANEVATPRRLIHGQLKRPLGVHHNEQ